MGINCDDALTVTAATISQTAEAGYMGQGNYNSAFSENDRFLSLMSNYQQTVGKKYSASKSGGNVYYVLTSLKSDRDKGSGIVGVNILSGLGESQIIFNDKASDYEVDDLSGRLFNMNTGTISAYSIADKTENADNNSDDDDN